MSKFFCAIYDFLEHRQWLLWILLLSIVGVCGYGALQIRFDENITNFFAEDDAEQNVMFDNLKVKDKIVVTVSGDNADSMIDAADVFVRELQPLLEQGLVNAVIDGVDESQINNGANFIYEYLPIFLDEEYYSQLASRLNDADIEQSVDNVFTLLTSPSGMMIGDVVKRDPLNVGTSVLRAFEPFSEGVQYELYAGHLFSQDMSTLMMFVEPSLGMGQTGLNDALVEGLERAEEAAEELGVEVDCIGAPIIAVYNARQIKQDTALTLSIAMIVIVLVVVLSFRNRRSIPLMIVPPAFGALVGLAVMQVVQGTVSAIAIGAGAVVLGVALSYSMHIIAHLNHTTNPRQIISDLAFPLTIGCLTTIGAFISLMFTRSSLLSDLGLFAAITLVGTTLFCLIFLPHFIRGVRQSDHSRLLKAIERGNEYSFERNKWIVGVVSIVTFVCLFFYNDVRFDDNMSNINYMPRSAAEAEERFRKLFGDDSRDVYLVSSSESLETLSSEYAKLQTLIDTLQAQGAIERSLFVDQLVVPTELQQERIERWNNFWAEHRQSTLEAFNRYSSQAGFRRGAFHQFDSLLNAEFEPCRYSSEQLANVPVLSDWANITDENAILLSQITLDEEHKDMVYASIEALGGTAIIDRAYFSSKMVESTSDNFNSILLFSSLIVFVALFFSYGRIELTLITFLPMCVSWVVILGFMAMFDIKFNIINIILATLIFGLGDDFSIFMMDGLMQEYRGGKRLMGAHKTAIFFSAFTAVVGMGVLFFAEHPALRSIALISVLGLCVVVLVAYTVQPLLFRLLVTRQTERGGFPFTLSTLLRTIYAFGLFLLGCIALQLFMLLLMCVPIRRERKKLIFHKFIYGVTRMIHAAIFSVRTVRENPNNEDYKRPAVIVANHQSVVDILLLLSTTPKLVMVTNSWVWNSPFFGHIVRYADFYHAADGYENLVERLRERVKEGYSIVIFPEGTRSMDGSVGRFHKGAFYLAQQLQIDLLPIVIYGAGHISSKRQSFYINSGTVVSRTLQRVSFGDTTYGDSYQMQAKAFRKMFVEELERLNDRYGRTSNVWFRNAVHRNYIYKGPVLEWYMRIKCRQDGYYEFWDRLIPRDATICDVGCGYGQMSFMLSLLSPRRSVVALDYDAEKIELARSSMLCHRTNVRFECADIRDCELPLADAFLFNDTLHYVSEQAQTRILTHAVQRLKEGGVMVVRYGKPISILNNSPIEHSEIWSTRIIKLNKTSEPLCYVDCEWMHRFADQNGLTLQVEEHKQNIYIFAKKSNDEQI